MTYSIKNTQFSAKKMRCYSLYLNKTHLNGIIKINQQIKSIILNDFNYILRNIKKMY
jgi:hypothetical protein